MTDYSSIVVNLDYDINGNSDQIISTELAGANSISLSDVLNYLERYKKIKDRFSDEVVMKINAYSIAFNSYNFSTVLLRREDIDSAIEVFTRINTGGQTLTLFEIMSAKTYDEKECFDMQVKWNDFSKELKYIKYEGVSSATILSLLSLVLSESKECKRKTILSLNKKIIIKHWDEAISSLKESIDYFRTTYRIPVSQLLPYDSLLVPFAYFFTKRKTSRVQISASISKNFSGVCPYRFGIPAQPSQSWRRI